MFNRQFNLLVMATLLLSPNLVNANEVDGNPNLSIGNIQIQTTGIGTTIQTPKIEITTPKATENRVIISRTRRRNLTQVRRGRTSKPAMIRQRVEDSDRQITTPTTQIRNSTIRSSRNEDSSESTIDQQQSVQCSGSGSSVSQSSSTTVNGRTISSEVRKNCQ